MIQFSAIYLFFPPFNPLWRALQLVNLFFALFLSAKRGVRKNPF